VTREFVSLASTSKPKLTSPEEGEFCSPRIFTGPGKHCGYGKPNSVLVWCFKLMVFGPWGGVPGVCLGGGCNLGRRLETFAVKGFVEPAGSRLFKFCMYCCVRVRSNNSVCNRLGKIDWLYESGLC